MTVMDSKTLKGFLPRNIADGIVQDVQTTSTVAKLSGAKPMRFGQTDIITFTGLPKANFVEENAKKGQTDASFGTVSVMPHKAEVTYRTSAEFLWADEDYQLGVLAELQAKAQLALSRALDFGVYHAINPRTGQKISGWENYVGASKLAVTHDAADADADIRSAVGLVVNSNKQVNGIALDPKESWVLANLQALSGGKPTGTPRYPQIGFGQTLSTFMGLNAAVGTTVSGLPEAKTDTGIRAIVGDFIDGIYWGVQKDLPFEVIPYGDPDNTGTDLKGANQVALRAEIVYGWYVFTDRFALVKETIAPGG